MTHKLIREAAKEFCGAFYEACERSPRFRQDAPSVRTFVSQHWPKYVPQVRATFAVMLRDPGRSEKEKADIYDALLEEQSSRTRMPSADKAWDDRELKFDDKVVVKTG